MNFKIPIDKNDYDLIFNEIKNIPKNWNPKKITDLIHEKLSLSLILARPVKKEAFHSILIFRLRIPNKGETINELNIAEFSYPPKKFSKMQRCNRSGEQVFYASADPHTPFVELSEDIKPGTICYISKWGIKDAAGEIFMRYLFYGITEGIENYASVMASGIKKAFHKIFKDIPKNSRNNLSYCQNLFQELFTSRGKEYYHITSSIVRQMFINGKIKNPNLNIPIIAYPSVAKDKKGVNFVFRKDFVDDFFYLNYIDKVIVNSVDKEKINYSPMSRGILKNGKLEWLKFKISVDTIHYDSVLISNDEIPKLDTKFIQVNSNEELFSCCSEHLFSLKYYLDKSKFNQSLLLEGIKEFPQEGLSSKFFDFRENIVFIPVDVNIYYNKDFTIDGKINIIGVPVTFKLEFIKSDL